MVGPVLSPLGTGAVVIVFVLFMLLKREDLRDRIIHLIGKGKLNVTTQALDEAAGKVTGYLTMQVIVNVCFGIPVGVGLWLIGIPNAFLWGLLATLLRFIPYVGAWIALGFPLVAFPGDDRQMVHAHRDAGTVSPPSNSSPATCWNPGSTARTPGSHRWRSW